MPAEGEGPQIHPPDRARARRAAECTRPADDAALLDRGAVPRDRAPVEARLVQLARGSGRKRPRQTIVDAARTGMSAMICLNVIIMDLLMI